MGVGKTVFVKGLARAMGIRQQITSPTYDLLSCFQSTVDGQQLAHIDTWRMIDPNSELDDLNIKKLITDRSIIAIEWADKAIEEIRKYLSDAIIIWVKIRYGKNLSDRLISWGNL